MMAADGRNDQTPEDGAEDAEASAALRETNAAVQRALVEVHRDPFGFLQRRLRNPEEAEEVLQRFVVRALERASELRDVRTVRGWLGRILATTIVDHQRRAIRGRRREVPTEPEALERASEVVAPDPEVDGIVCDCLYKLLPTLRAEYAEVIWRADILGEPRDRIAASLGTSLNAVNVRLHRGRRALKRRLEETCLTCTAHQENRLATDRLYGLVRHPQYTGLFIGLFGEGVVHWPTIFSVTLFPAIVIAYTLLAYREERHMLEQFGDEYRIYQKRVPMFFPGKGRWRQFLQGSQMGP
jgi:RNA polymerase sigma factor (sigma-70 family)